MSRTLRKEVVVGISFRQALNVICDFAEDPNFLGGSFSSYEVRRLENAATEMYRKLHDLENKDKQKDNP